MSPVAVQVPVARTFPRPSVWVKPPVASTPFGLTENSPSPVTAIWSPFAATPILGSSITSRYACVALSATATVGTSTTAAASVSASRIRRLMKPSPGRKTLGAEVYAPRNNQEKLGTSFVQSSSTCLELPCRPEPLHTTQAQPFQ